MEKIDVAGLKISRITKIEFLNQILNRIKTGKKTFVITPYSEFLYYGFQNPALLETFNAADFSLADGIGILWAKKFLDLPLTVKSFYAKICHTLWQILYSLAAIIFYPSWIKSALPEKIVGADLVWDLAKMAKKNNLSIYLLGGFGDTPKLAAEKLSVSLILGRGLSTPGNLQIAGWSNKNPDDPSIIGDINKVSPDILLVAFGPIKQEQWIAKNLPQLNTKLAIGVGGSFDYITGKKSAPPKFIRYGGLEWLWRLITQPYRLGRIINATFGLANGLWHYKVFNIMPLRPNIVCVILNKNNKVLVCKRRPRNSKVDIITTPRTLATHNYWQLPQGGIEPGENLESAGKREAMEETGLQNLSLIKFSEQRHSYILNNSLRKFRHNIRFPFKGQSQQLAYYKYSGNDSGVKIDNLEFIDYKWIAISDLQSSVHIEREGITKIAFQDLKEMAEKGII